MSGRSSRPLPPVRRGHEPSRLEPDHLAAAYGHLVPARRPAAAAGPAGRPNKAEPADTRPLPEGARR